MFEKSVKWLTLSSIEWSLNFIYRTVISLLRYKFFSEELFNYLISIKQNTLNCKIIVKYRISSNLEQVKYEGMKLKHFIL